MDLDSGRIIESKPFRINGFRRTRMSRGLVKALPDEVQSTKILNVDASDTGMATFLERLGFDHLIDQYEMIRPI